MNIDHDIIVIGSVVAAFIARTVHASLIYAKMKAQIDSVASNCITLADFTIWQNQLNIKNRDLVVPDMTEIMTQRKRATADQEV